MRWKELTTNETRYMRELPVRVANALIQKSQFDLTAAQFDILIHVISLKKPNDNPGTLYEFTIKDYYEMKGCDNRSGGNYADFKSNIDAIDKLRFWMSINGERVRLQWFHRLLIIPDSGTIKFSFNDDVVPYLYNLTERYTDAKKINSLVLKSKYSKYLYYYLCSHAYRVCFEITLEEFCKEACPNEYKEYKDIKRRVLEVAKDEINEHTDISFLYEAKSHGVGKKITHIRFIVGTAADGLKRGIYDKAHILLDETNSKVR